MRFQGFKKESLEFLEEIKQNNNKDWFEVNRDRYDRLILEPSKFFVEEMGEHLMALEPTIKFLPKINYSLFKIYRDTRRMGANKEPLKSRIGIIFWQGGKKRLQNSSFYLHFSHDELFVSVGIRWFEKPMLDAYREYIKDKKYRENLHNILKNITSKGYKVIDKGYKRYPRGFSDDMVYADLSLYKGMATYTTLDPKIMANPELFIDKLFKIYEDMLLLQQFMFDVSLKVKFN